MTNPKFAMGIDLGGTKILAVILTPEGQIVTRAKRRTRAEKGSKSIINRIVKAANKAVEESGIAWENIACVGIGAPGTVDSIKGVVSEAPNLDMKDFPLAATLQERLGRPVFGCNDANAGTWGECAALPVVGAGEHAAKKPANEGDKGAAHNAGSVLGVFVGTGIGGGLVINGALYEGAGMAAGEIGHMCIDPDGPTCGCGRRGCLEAFASKTAIERELRMLLKKGGKSEIAEELHEKGKLRSSMLARAWEAGDSMVERVLERAIAHLGAGLGGVANLLNPDLIVLGGGVAQALGEKYLKKVEAAMRKYEFDAVKASTRLVACALGDDAVATGAGLLALRKTATRTHTD